MGIYLGRCWRVLFVVVVLAASLAAPMGAAEAALYEVYKTEAETLTLPPGGKVYADTAASGGKAIQLPTVGTAARWAWVTSASQLTVRARGIQCKGSPRMTVKFGQQTLLSVNVTQTTWTNINAPVNVVNGWYPVSVQFSNDYTVNGQCSRALMVDKLVLSSPTAINQGITGSVCQGNDGGLQVPPLPTDYNTTWLGTAPGYYELAFPTGEFAGQAPIGVMMLIHGGGWHLAGPAAAAGMRGQADEWRARGWAIVNASSGLSCGAWLDDMIWFHDKIRELMPTTPICALGGSAGGHLSLMLAIRRATLHCAISQGGPTDLVALAEQTAYDPATNASTQTAGPEWGRQLAIAAFGEYRMAELSPALHAESIFSRVTASVAEQDVFLPTVQVQDLMRAMDELQPAVHHTSLVLEPGPIPWVHANVSAAALDQLRGLEIATAAVT